MKIDELTFDQVKTLALRCTIQLPKRTGLVPLDRGEFLAYAAKAEEIRRYTKIAKRDLFDRELRGGSYPGDHGHVTIGGKRFTLYKTTPPTLIRDDFSLWIEANWHKVLNSDGSERKSNKPLRVDDVKCLPVSAHAFQAKMRAKDLNEPTELIHEDAWNTEYEMEEQLHRYHAEIERDRKAGKYYIVTRLQGVLLAAMAQHRRRNYAEAVDDFISVAACAIKAAEYEARMHSKAHPEQKTPGMVVGS